MKLRKANKEDLSKLKYDKECDSCALDGITKKGAYRGPDFYVCEECFLKNAKFEE